MLGGQGEELADVPRPGLPEGFEQALDHGPKQLVRVQVEGRPGETGVTAVQLRRPKQAQASQGPVEQVAYDRVGRRACGQGVQIPLDDGARLFAGHS